ncbi:small, acid-soluble spore protein, alpha/beta type [Virgibacillus sp. FSP13]
MAKDNNNNDLLVPGAENAMDNMKEEIANEFGVQPGADTTARENGSVGGEMVKRMIQIAEQSMQNRNK